jgi:hypothetical protein
VGLDGDRGEAVGAEVIGAGAHVEQARLGGQLERGEQQVAADPGVELVGPAIEVHVGVEAAGLL